VFPKEKIHIFTVATYSASVVDEFNRIKGCMFIVKLKEKLSTHDHSSDHVLKLTIEYEKNKKIYHQKFEHILLKIHS